ncbi:hypothetical protein [Paenibacillus turpanensis]|uniref:hypothetical protein n=1 Tax=Paenibacillus turpanensis TaxID=2689078 RepID=UPI001408A0ED|nr:hypothetical protein [Paenibacillus turpanensis]
MKSDQDTDAKPVKYKNESLVGSSIDHSNDQTKGRNEVSLNQADVAHQRVETKQEPFFGKWNISQLLEAKVTALSQEDVDRINNTPFVFNTQYAEVNGVRLEKPRYQIVMTTVQELIDGGIILGDLGMALDDPVMEITIKRQDNEKWEWNILEFGGSLYYAHSKMYLSLAGALFELEKSKEENLGAFTGGHSHDFLGVWKIKSFIEFVGNERRSDTTDEWLKSQFVFYTKYSELAGLVIKPLDYQFLSITLEKFKEIKQISADLNVDGKPLVNQILILPKDKDELKRFVEIYGAEPEFYFIQSKMFLFFNENFFELEKVENHQGNRVNKHLIQEGQTFNGLTVKKVERSDEAVTDITFSGEVDLTGSYQWNLELNQIIFQLEERSLQQLPVLDHILNENSIQLHYSDELEQKLPPPSGTATIRITNYSMGEREVTMSADVVKILKAKRDGL